MLLSLVTSMRLFYKVLWSLFVFSHAKCETTERIHIKFYTVKSTLKVFRK